MEIAKFILTAVGTFLSVLALSFTVFQYWRKKQEEKLEELKTAFKNGIAAEKSERKEEIERLSRKIEKLENMVFQNLEQRLSTIEGLLRGMRPTLDKIQEWFINNTPGRGK
jgi:DNA anti-recombination protein RmuC